MRLMPKYFLLFLLSMIYFNSASAQNFSFNWGAVAKQNRADFEDAVSLKNGNFILLRFDVKTGMFGKSDEYSPILILVDKDLNEIKTQALEVPDKKSSFKSLEQLGNDILFIYECYNNDSKTTTVKALTIDETSLTVIRTNTLAVLGSSNKNSQAVSKFKFSSKFNKLLLFSESSYKKENIKFFIGVFDSSLNVEWKKEIELPILWEMGIVHSYEITDEGKVVIVIKHYDKGSFSETVKENGEKVSGYTFKLYVFDINSTKEVILNLNDKVVHTAKLTNTNYGIVMLGGIYKQKPKGKLGGVFTAKIDVNKGALINPIATAFPQELIEAVANDDFGSKKGSDIGLDDEFTVINFVNRRGDVVDMSIEYRKEKIVTSMNSRNNSFTSYTTYLYGDIINISIDKTQKIAFTRIPKSQGYASLTYLGCSQVFWNDKLIFLYNDSKKNVEKDLSKPASSFYDFSNSYLVASTLDQNGNLTREMIFKNADDDRYVIEPSSIKEINSANYFIRSGYTHMFNIRTRFGIMNVK